MDGMYHAPSGSRRSVQNDAMKPPVWIPLVFTPLQLIGAYAAGDLISRGSWINFAIPGMLLIGVPSVVLMWVAWGLLSWRTPPRATRWLVAVGIILPFVCAAAAFGIAWLIESYESARTARQLAHAQVLELSDEPLFGAGGNPIGVRITYRVRFEEGLDDRRYQPFATLHVESPPDNLAVHRVQVTPNASGRYERGEYRFTEEFTPSFLPRFLRFPELAPRRNDSDRCFSWGNESMRRAADDRMQQRLVVQIPSYGIERRTVQSYALADFYEGATREGAREC
jgi:hypothetical protein